MCRYPGTQLLVGHAKKTLNKVAISFGPKLQKYIFFKLLNVIFFKKKKSSCLVISALSLFVVNPILQREKSPLPGTFIFPIHFLAQHMPLMELEMTEAQPLF